MSNTSGAAAVSTTRYLPFRICHLALPVGLGTLTKHAVFPRNTMKDESEASTYRGYTNIAIISKMNAWDIFALWEIFVVNALKCRWAS